MLLPFRFLVWALTRSVLWLRYRVCVHGREQLARLRPHAPVLILPNHPGYVDPLLVLTTLWMPLRPRPMLLASMFQNPLLRPLMYILEAIRVPDLERASAEARAQAEQAVQEVIDGLKHGRNHILWPSGRVQRDGRERLGAARALTDILRAVPDAEVLLVRTRGVWGSTFSYAYTGQAPPLGKRLLQGIGWLAANLLFFMPRRRVDITLERIDRSQLPPLEREAINPWFEERYNRDANPERPTFVPYHFLFGKRTYEFPQRPGRGEVDLTQITAETRAAVNEMVEEKLSRPLATEERDRPQTSLEQLGLDSLQRMELGLDVEQRFGFTSHEVPETLGELWALGQGLLAAAPPRPAPAEWFRPATGPDDVVIEGETLPEAFLHATRAHPDDVAVADDLAGVLTNRRLLLGALLLSRRFASLPGTNVGLMLPSSVGCDLALFALQRAGKLPVLLNWTTGPANLAHAARLMELTHVVTSRQFLDRAGVNVEGVEYLFVEDVRRQVGKWDKFRAWFQVRFRPGSLTATLPLSGSPQPDDPAVVLFTSGSEKAPKAVPLTHRNLLANQRAVIASFHLTRHDSVLAFLPAFHSFGLSITTLLPILGGLRVVHHPTPTDASGLAHKIASYRPTVLLGTPTFVGYILDRARPEQLASLRLIVVGAEKCPQELFDRSRQLAPKADLVEGYGITECSPVVSVNRPEANRPGTVGQPLPGVEVRVVDLDSEEPLPADHQGMLQVAGPTIFPGYIGHEGPPPFAEGDGKRWYVTGDLARVDGDGFIHFAGRLKRFLKAGGEMISLPALEEPFARRYPPTEKGPRVAVEGVETPTGRRIVLFTTEPIELREANQILTEEGFRGVMRLDEVRRVGALPLLGTGKTDYKVLRARIAGEGLGKG